MENSYFDNVVKEAIEDIKKNKVGYVFSKEQVEAVIKKIEESLLVIDKDGIFKLIME